MELRDVDQFVREGKYDQALRAIDAVRSLDPHNPYTAAYEVRVRALLEEAARNTPEPTEAIPASAPGIQHEFPSVESQMRSIATAIPADRPRGTVSTDAAGEMERIAVLSRIADLLGSATGSLSRGEYDRALVALEQARVLDPGNTEIAVFEDRVRAAHHEAQAMHLVPEERCRRLGRSRPFRDPRHARRRTRGGRPRRLQRGPPLGHHRRHSRARQRRGDTVRSGDPRGPGGAAPGRRAPEYRDEDQARASRPGTGPTGPPGRRSPMPTRSAGTPPRSSRAMSPPRRP